MEVVRICVGKHRASNVLGAYLSGTLKMAAIIKLYCRGKPRFFVHQPVAKSAAPEA